MDEATSSREGAVRHLRGGLPPVAARVMSLLPRAPLELAAAAVMRRIVVKNPGLITRLGPHTAKRFAVDPLDCPFVFLIEPRPNNPTVRVLASLSPGDWDARIAGTMIVLMGLLEGIYDGDALFFSRDLTIEGDTAAALALRNAIEDSDIDPGRLTGAPDRMAAFLTTGFRTLTGHIRTVLDAPEGTASAGPRPHF
jgi:predicted lipid carrier protein YhbT